MIERLKYNFWLIVFIANTLFFLFFLYQAFSFTSVYAFRWLFFLSGPFFTSGIHLLIKSRSTKAEWLSIVNFGLTALLILYFNALPDALETRWTWFCIPIFNQLFINTFDVIWSNNYRYKLPAVISIGILWLTTCISILTDFTWLYSWVVPFTFIVGIIVLTVVILGTETRRQR